MSASEAADSQAICAAGADVAAASGAARASDSTAAATRCSDLMARILRRCRGLARPGRSNASARRCSTRGRGLAGQSRHEASERCTGTDLFDAALPRCAGGFATGVTIVTARDADGAPVGLTANSFNSVSLAPPLVLWSLWRRAGSMQAFARGSHYAINILAADQHDLAERFAEQDAGPLRRRSPGARARAARRCSKARRRCSNASTAASTRKATTSSSSARSSAARAGRAPRR